MSAKSTTSSKKVKSAAAPAVEILEVGTPVKFLGYASGEPGALEAGKTYVVHAYWPDDALYDLAVKATSKTALDSVTTDEFEVIDAAASTPSKKAAAKKPKAAAVEVEEEEEEEAEEEGPMVVVDDEPAAASKKAAAKKAAKAEPAAPAAKPQPVKQLSSVKEAIAEAGGNAVTAADNLHGTVEFTYLVLGGVLAVIQSTDAHADPSNTEVGQSPYAEGQKGFAKYVEARLGMKYRKAQYLINIYETITKLGISESKLKGIGWSKLKDLVVYLNSGADANEALELARKLSGSELRDEIKRRMVSEGKELHGNASTSHEMDTFTFSVHNDQAETIREALKTAAEALDVADPNEDPTTLGACFNHIVSEWYNLQG
ncbi:hypothetical protein UFOVP783_96 [uncultured Caudovirales phage]|uniref:Uncharacterized protein n=1 Tax=uncultured Caudovirales phage TaxID=2100421 RepID=A0A6J5NSC4_9CAUD|nr:hypothetical protein UFOVP783_96 [uncultured Caudovirales phage]